MAEALLRNLKAIALQREYVFRFEIHYFVLEDRTGLIILASALSSRAGNNSQIM